MNDAAHAHDSHHEPIRPLRRLSRLLKPERKDIWLVVAFSLAVGVLGLATPVAVQALVNFVAFGNLFTPLIVLSVMLLFFLVVAGVIRALSVYVVEVLQRRVFVRVVSALGDRLPRVRLDAFDREHGPELVNRFFDVLTVQKVGATLLLDGLAVILSTFIGLLILAFYHPILFVFDLVLVGLMLVVLCLLARGAYQTAVHESHTKYDVAASLEEIARSPLAFKQADASSIAYRRADLLASEYVSARRDHFRNVFRQVISAFALQAIAATALLSIGGYLVIIGELTLGQLVAAELIVAVVLDNFTKLGRKLESVYDLAAGVFKIDQLLELPVERSTGIEIEGDPGTGANVCVKGLAFAYEEGPRVLANVNFDARPGERLAIIGNHASGKSTLAELLCGAREPTEGRVEIDGVDLREVCLSSLRDDVSIVRDPEIIEGTVSDNICMWLKDVTPEQIRGALADVGLLEEIRALPGGLDTKLSPSGAPLSRGQAMRLMFARAIAHSPRLIIVDDVLSDLDNPALERITGLLRDQSRPWTVIILGHHDWLIGHADRSIRLGGPSGIIDGQGHPVAPSPRIVG